VEELTEIRWHARGGQGAVTAAKLLAEMALAEDLYFQAFPEYGPERMGAPIQCFNRLSKIPISIYTSVEEPDLVVVVDPTLLGTVDVTRGLKPGGGLLINSSKTPAELQKELAVNNHRLFTIDATRISLEAMGRAMPNTPMLGALLRVLNVIPLEVAVEYLQESFAPKFGPKVTAGNLTALQRAFAEVQGV